MKEPHPNLFAKHQDRYRKLLEKWSKYEGNKKLAGSAKAALLLGKKAKN